MVQEKGPWSREHQCKNQAKGKLESGKPGCQMHINKEARFKIKTEQAENIYKEYRARVAELRKIKDELGYGFICIPKPDSHYVHIALSEREAKEIIERLTPTIVDRNAIKR